ncbi:hypothetical protein MXB_1763 [Myxobolus squamalis]|nr:hypothetical protein MXB_1763 [Myxobolus squamalis]
MCVTCLSNYVKPITILAFKIRSISIFLKFFPDSANPFPILAEFNRFLMDFFHEWLQFTNKLEYLIKIREIFSLSHLIKAFDILYQSVLLLKKGVSADTSSTLLNYYYENMIKINYEMNSLHYQLIASLFATLYKKYLESIDDFIFSNQTKIDEIVLIEWVNDLEICGKTRCILFDLSLVFIIFNDLNSEIDNNIISMSKCFTVKNEIWKKIMLEMNLKNIKSVHKYKESILDVDCIGCVSIRLGSRNT